jgi:DNA-binding XRE family transcriptional regulator
MRQTLQQARKRAGKTQGELAKMVGISERWIREIEAGVCKPNVETAISIARALGETVEDLF